MIVLPASLAIEKEGGLCGLVAESCTMWKESMVEMQKQMINGEASYRPTHHVQSRLLQRTTISFLVTGQLDETQKATPLWCTKTAAWHPNHPKRARSSRTSSNLLSVQLVGNCACLTLSEWNLWGRSFCLDTHVEKEYSDSDYSNNFIGIWYRPR